MGEFLNKPPVLILLGLTGLICAFFIFLEFKKECSYKFENKPEHYQPLNEYYVMYGKSIIPIYSKAGYYYKNFCDSNKKECK